MHLLHGVNNFGQLDIIQVLQGVGPVMASGNLREKLEVGKAFAPLVQEKIPTLLRYSYKANLRSQDESFIMAAESRNSRLQEAYELFSFLLGLVGHDASVGLSLHAPQMHWCLCCNMSLR